MKTHYNASSLAESWLKGDKAGELPNGCAKIDATGFFSWDTLIAIKLDGHVRLMAVPMTQTSAVHQTALIAACARNKVPVSSALDAIAHPYECIPKYAFGTPVKLVNDLFGKAYDVPLMGAENGTA